jgi:GNAT superfamily N-acetyltransferase
VPYEKLDTYRPAIYSKWLRGQRYGSPQFKEMEPNEYFETYKRVIERTLNDERCLVRFAVLTDEPDVFLGFSISRGAVLDYVYVHKDARRHGIATSLVPRGIERFTGFTTLGAKIAKAKGWKWNPFI